MKLFEKKYAKKKISSKVEDEAYSKLREAFLMQETIFFD